MWLAVGSSMSHAGGPWGACRVMHPTLSFCLSRAAPWPFVVESLTVSAVGEEDKEAFPKKINLHPTEEAGARCAVPHISVSGNQLSTVLVLSPRCAGQSSQPCGPEDSASCWLGNGACWLSSTFSSEPGGMVSPTALQRTPQFPEVCSSSENLQLCFEALIPYQHPSWCDARHTGPSGHINIQAGGPESRR